MPIEFVNVDFSYDGENKIFENFNFKLPDTGAVCLRGPSGCGKTTFLRLIAGLEFPQSGEIKGLESLKKAVVFQEDRLLNWHSAIDNVAVVTKGQKGRELAAKWLDKVGLEGQTHKRPGQLSGGMQRRVAIARALAADADILIMDEPFTGLDDELIISVSREIMSVYSKKPIIMVSHSDSLTEGFNPIVYNFEGPPLRLK